MAEDRMLSDEILLGLINKNSGGGGTTDYEDLNNLPEINNVELKGNKSLADLGIASAQDVKKEFIGTLAEWNALTTAQQKEYDTYQLTDDYSEALMPNYSTTATKTGQKWMDGRDVYMVVYQPSSPVVVANNNWIDIGMSASGIGKFLEITGIAEDGACCAMVGATQNGNTICLASRPDGAFTAVEFVVKYVEPSV